MHISQIPGYLSRARKDWVPLVYWSDEILQYFEAIGTGLDSKKITRCLLSGFLRGGEVRADLMKQLPHTQDVLGVTLGAIIEVLEECMYPVIFLSDPGYRKKSAKFTTGEQEYFLDGLLAKISLEMLKEEDVLIPFLDFIARDGGGGLLFGECKYPNWKTLSDIKGYKSFGFLCTAFEAYGCAIYCTQSFADRLPDTGEYDWEDA